FAGEIAFFQSVVNPAVSGAGAVWGDVGTAGLAAQGVVLVGNGFGRRGVGLPGLLAQFAKTVVEEPERTGGRVVATGFGRCYSVPDVHLRGGITIHAGAGQPALHIIGQFGDDIVCIDGAPQLSEWVQIALGDLLDGAHRIGDRDGLR